MAQLQAHGSAYGRAWNYHLHHQYRTASFLFGMGAAMGQMAFNAAKAAVEQLLRDPDVHLACSNVRMNALAVGPIETRESKAMLERIGPEQAARRFTHMPMGRFGRLNELAATAAYLASDDAGFVTAASFPLSGGIQNAFTVPDTPPSAYGKNRSTEGKTPPRPIIRT